MAATFVQKTAAENGGRMQQFVRTTVDTTDHTGVPHIESVTIAGPFKPTGSGDTPSRRRIFVCRPTAPSAETRCATRIVTALARRAYRRPVTQAEMAGHDVLRRRRAGTFDTGLSGYRERSSPARIVFRFETEPADAPPGAPYRLNDVDLASRLSFSWSSISDDEPGIANRGQLKAPAILEQQVR